jgi:hypothetical protein
MKKIVMVLFAGVAIAAFAADTQVKGYLLAQGCASESHKPGFGAKHPKECLERDECAKSGYGVLTDDQKFIKFDAAGNEQAKKFISALTKKSDIKVAVTGNVDGDQIAVSKIELQ